MSDRLKKIMIIVIGVFVVFFLFLFMLSGCKKKLTPENLESEIVENTKNYFSSHKEELPGDGIVLTLSINDLVSKGIIDELDDLLENDTNCSGNIIIENNNGYYMYSPNLNCTSTTGNYETKSLKSILLEKVVTSGSGLYNINNAYFFRGDTVDNYIKFDGILWRITKINEDGTIRLLEDNRRTAVQWDDRYNSERFSNTGINNYVNNGLNSRIKDYLENIYNTEDILSNDGKGYIKPTTLCVGKRSPEETNNTGSVECSETIDDQYIGLLQVNEYLIASLDSGCVKTTSVECTNYNYLSKFISPYWTITSNSENNYQVYKITNNASLSNANNSSMARLVINISENTNVTGTGTEEDPYLVTGFDTELKKFN